MYGQALIVTAISYETIKHRLTPDILFPSIEELIEAHFEDDRETEPCTGDITCERIGVRHKANCLGKTEPIDSFWRGILALPELEDA